MLEKELCLEGYSVLGENTMYDTKNVKKDKK